MPLLDAIRGAWRLLTGDGNVEHTEPWASDERSFEDHFGVPYIEFADAVSGLSRGDFELYEKTLQVNPEASVLWVIWRHDLG